MKSLALNNKNGITKPCLRHGNCKCCNLIGQNVETILERRVPSAPGDCKSKNLIYLITCKKCLKPYIGRTVQTLAKRMSGHRENFYKVIRNSAEVDSLSDDYSLGLHLANEHGCSNLQDFDTHYNAQIIQNCSPKMLEKSEHSLLHRFNTLVPMGLNKCNPFGLPVLNSV